MQIVRLPALAATIVVLAISCAAADDFLLTNDAFISTRAFQVRAQNSEPIEVDSVFEAAAEHPETVGQAEGTGFSNVALDLDGAEPDPQLSKLEQRLDKLAKSFDAIKAPKRTTYPTFKITGFTQLDGGWYSQSAKNIATVGDAQDGVGFRRARLAVQGKAAEFTNYQLELDFATAGRPSFFDTYVEQESLPYLGSVRVGHFLQPFSVDALSGFRNLPFLERSLPFLAFVPFRRDGIMSQNMSEDERTTWAYSVFRTGGFNNAPLGDSRFATDFGDVGGYSFSTRVTHLLRIEDDGKCLFQIGGSYDFSQLGANDAIGSGDPNNAGSPRPFYQARVTPEFGPLGLPENNSSFGNAANGTPTFASTGRYEANNFNLYGVEALYQDGPLSLQGEWMGTVVDSVVGPVFYNGAYGEVMYRLTGEHREYDKRLGTLKNPIPFNDFISIGRGPDRGVRGWGAWEIAARWSFVDLRNPSKLNGHYYDTTTNTFTGNSHAGTGTLNDSTIGVSWFLNANTKIQANWICALLDNQAKGFSVANLFVSRVQVSF